MDSSWDPMRRLDVDARASKCLRGQPARGGGRPECLLCCDRHFSGEGGRVGAGGEGFSFWREGTGSPLVRAVSFEQWREVRGWATL